MPKAIVMFVKYVDAANKVVGGYSMQLGDHVRMDLLYSGRSSKNKGFIDSLTSFCLDFYLIMLLYGGLSSTQYALFYGEKATHPGSPTWHRSKSSCASASP